MRFGVQRHKVAVEKQFGMGADMLNELRAEGNGRHEIPVHDVAMRQIGAALLQPREGLPCRRKIARQNRRRNFNLHVSSPFPQDIPPAPQFPEAPFP